MRKLLAKLLVLFVLNVGATFGVPMDPEKIKRLMEVMHRTQIVQIMEKEEPKPPEER